LWTVEEWTKQTADIMQKFTLPKAIRFFQWGVTESQEAGVLAWAFYFECEWALSAGSIANRLPEWTKQISHKSFIPVSTTNQRFEIQNDINGFPFSDRLGVEKRQGRPGGNPDLPRKRKAAEPADDEPESKK